MKQIELASGTANVTVMVNLTSSTGAPVTGITYSGVPNCTYIREGDAAPTAITLVAGTVGTYVSGGWIEVSSTLCPGWYELGLPANAVNSFTARWVCVCVSGVTGAIQSNIQVQMTQANLQNNTNLGLAAFPTVAPGQPSGLALMENIFSMHYTNSDRIASAPADSPPGTATTFTCTTAAKYSVGNLLVYYGADPYVTATAAEIMMVTGVSGTTVTVTRGVFGTVPIALAGTFTIYFAEAKFAIVPGAVGSVTAPVTLPSVPAGYATSAAQATIEADIAALPTSAQNATAAAAAILTTPANKLATDVNGNVTFNNAIPVPPTTTQIQAALAAGSALPAVLSASQNFNNTGQTTNYPTSATSVTLAASQDFNNTGQTTPYPTSGGGGGSGSAALSFTVKSTASGTPVIPNATISVIDASGAAVTSGVTNGSGVASGMACAPGSYTYAVNASNFAGISGILTPAPVAGNNPYTFSLVPISPVVPLSGSIVGVSNTYVDGVVTGSVAVEYYMASVGSTSGSAFSGATSLSPLTATSNASGVLSIAFPYGTIWRIKGNPDVEIDVPTSGTQFEMPSVRI